LTFFIDNNLSPSLAEGLRAFGQDVHHLREDFAPDTADEAWLPVIAQWEWYLISRDKKIASNHAKRAALMGLGLGAFLFTLKRNPSYWEWVEIIIKRWSELRDWASEHERPFVVGIPESGRLREY
jgi:hypothetical protein